MEFTLVYQGPLKSNGSPADKHKLREVFHDQLTSLWRQLPLREYHRLLNEVPDEGSISVIRSIGNFSFAPLVSEKLNLIASASITLLRPEEPGSLITQGGDIDNRIKTLFDGLRMPSQPQEIPVGAAPSPGQSPFFCVLEDDNLVTSVSVKTDRLLIPNAQPNNVVALIHIVTNRTRGSFLNIGL